MPTESRAELEGKVQAFVRAMMLSIGPKPDDDDYFAAFIAAAVIAESLGATYSGARHELARQVAGDVRERLLSDAGPLGVS